ncbi:ORF MSV092 hypothetical protein [Melanoplus sanguinipes entomopoxvirus]|uniref:Uncharacterized protein n=1 Tax=Melanoplus sanguinipes entomopoxvirus TaxID=83191 RepID=Q9YW00_MSEPV|nr:ORF MSV092 hypothetical protein [Melanoplus sanguinipes entomopoxvirus]AAC97642.1 ORF MSV092 hypothetical protein [Melanoplus sanguinipes entomopoxvirus 'O']
MNLDVASDCKIYIPYFNYGLHTNYIKSLLPYYYHNDNLKFGNIKDIIYKFTKNDFISLSTNKLTNNILSLLNSISDINLYKLINEYGYYLISNEILYDLFIPFDSFIMNNKKYILYIDELYFDNLNIKNYVIKTKSNILLSINKTKYFNNNIQIEFPDIKPQIISYYDDNIYYSNYISNKLTITEFYMTYYDDGIQ